MQFTAITNSKPAFSLNAYNPANFRKPYFMFIIASQVALSGWSVKTYQNTSESEHGCDVYAEKGKGKIAINICFDDIDMAEITRRQAELKAGGIRGLWLLNPCDGATCAIDDRINYQTSDTPIFTVLQHADLAAVHGMKYFDEGVFKKDYAFHEAALGLDAFIHCLFHKEVSFKPQYDNDVFFHCAIQQRTCFRCQNKINTVSKIVYTRRIFGQFVNEDYWQASSVREVPESEINLINSTFSAKYNFAPIKKMFSKFAQTEYMANSCSNCGVLMGAFFEGNDVYSPVELTEKITSTLSAESCFNRYELANGTGAWVADNSSYTVEYAIEDALDFKVIDFDDSYEKSYDIMWFSLLALPDIEDEDEDEYEDEA